jgi:hypothetical protein
MNRPEKSLSRDYLVSQSQEGEKMTGCALKSFIKGLISDYATYDDYNNCNLPIHKIPHELKRIFLSYLCDLSDYKFYCKNDVRLRIAFKDYEDVMQDKINDLLQESYQDAMEEMGLTLNHHRDNGEPYYYRR